VAQIQPRIWPGTAEKVAGVAGEWFIAAFEH
jgi:hypothetical protein